MKEIYTGKQIKAAEEAAFLNGVSAQQMMYCAGRAVASAIRQRKSVENKNILILCGKGNNGGDGFVVARELYLAGARVCTAIVSELPRTKEAQHVYRELPKGVVQTKNIRECEPYFDGADIIIDALYGFGFYGRLDDLSAAYVEFANKSCAYRVAVDVPSGAECDTGAVGGACFAADLTVTFTAQKPVQFLFPGAEKCGETVVANVGLPEEYLAQTPPWGYIFAKRDAKSKMPYRPLNSNKGTFGRVLSLCGNYGMTGAAVFCGRAALHSGIGLLQQVADRQTYPILASAMPEAVFILPDIYGEECLVEAAKRAAAVVIGCGMGQRDRAVANMATVLKNSNCPVVLDADALNIIAQNPDLLMFYRGKEAIMTPHPGEAARLLDITVDDVQRGRMAAIKALVQKYKCTVVLKGANPIVCAPGQQPVVVPCVNTGLSKGGSGDCLAGMVAAFAAQDCSAFWAACMGCYIHAACGEQCTAQLGERYVQPMHLIKALSAVLQDLT